MNNLSEINKKLKVHMFYMINKLINVCNRLASFKIKVSAIQKLVNMTSVHFILRPFLSSKTVPSKPNIISA